MKKCLLAYKQVLYGFMGLLTLALGSCEEEKKELAPTFSAGVLIFTEGPAGSPAGNLSFYNRATGTLEEDVFQQVNGRAPGGHILGMTSLFERLYLYTSAQQIEVLRENTLVAGNPINKVPNPQRLVALTAKRGFVSSYTVPTDSGQVFEIDLGTYQVKDTLRTGLVPTGMVLAGARLFVMNATGNTVNVFNTTSMEPEGNLTVGQAPNSMLLDGAANLWVLSGGTATVPGRLVRINPRSPVSADNPPTAFNFTGTASQPHGLALSASKNRLFYLNNGVYVMDMNATALPTTPLIKRNFQLVAQDPTDGLLYAVRPAPDKLTSWILRYQSSGALVDSFLVKGVATGFQFR